MGYSQCAVFGCRSNSAINKNLSFHRLPKESDRLKEWLHVIDREDLGKKKKPFNYRVCSMHFSESMFINKRLIPDAIPTLHLHNYSESSDLLQGNDLKIDEAKNVTKMIDKQTQAYLTEERIIASNSKSKAVQTEYQCHCKDIENVPFKTFPKLSNSVSTIYETSTSADLFTACPEKTFSTSASKPDCVQTTKQSSQKLPIKNKMRAKLRKYKLKIRRLEQTLKEISGTSGTLPRKRKSNVVLTDKTSDVQRKTTDTVYKDKEIGSKRSLLEALLIGEIDNKGRNSDSVLLDREFQSKRTLDTLQTDEERNSKKKSSKITLTDGDNQRKVRKSNLAHTDTKSGSEKRNSETGDEDSGNILRYLNLMLTDEESRCKSRKSE